MYNSHPTARVYSPLYRSFSLGLAVVTGAILVSGCAMWPKSLSIPFFGGSQAESPVAEPAAVVSVSQPVVSAQPVVAAVQPAPVAVPAPVTEAPKAETTLIAGVPADTMSAATKASLGIQSPVATPAPAALAKPASAPLAGGELVPGFYLNIGLFAVPSNGVNAHKRLEAAGMPVFSDGIKNKKGALTRVRVGPFATQALAQAAAQKIHTMKMEAVVFQK